MRKHKKFIAGFFLLLLISIASVLGFLILKMPKNSEQSPPTKKQRELSEDEKTLLKTPQKDASEEKKSAHFAVVQRLAKRTEFLDLSACYGDPLAFRAHEGTKFSVKNNDAVSHTLQISPEHIYTIPAKGAREITAQFGFGPGVYGYGCDDSPEARGILFIVK